MKKVIWIVVFLTFLGNPLHAQSPVVTPGTFLEWDQSGVNVSAYTYRYYLDGALIGSVLNSVTCNATADPNFSTCFTLFPTVSPGTHSLELTAQNEVGESSKSLPFAFAFVVAPTTPTNIRIRK